MPFSNEDVIYSEQFIKIFAKAKWEVAAEDAIEISKITQWLGKMVGEIKIQVQESKQQKPLEIRKVEDPVTKPAEPVEASTGDSE